MKSVQKMFLRLCVALIILSALTACGGGGGNTTSSGGGPAGVTFSGPYGAEVFVPVGALSSAVTITIARESDTAPVFPPSDVAVVGSTYEITPHGTTFALPVTVRIPFDPTQVPAGATPALYKAEPGGEFSEIISTVVGTALVAEVTDFSHFISAAGYPYLEFAYSTGANAGVGTLYGFSVDAASGVLAPTTQATYPNGASVMSSAVDRDGRYYYAVTTILGAPVGSPRYSLKQYTIDSAGGLVPVTSVSEFALPVDVTGAPTIVVGPTGTSAYLVGGSADTLQYSIGADGALTSLSTPTVAGGGNPRNLAVAPSGKYAYTVDAGEIRHYAAAPDGALTTMSTATAETAAGTFPAKIVVAPSGKFAYVMNSVSDNSISQYSIGQSGMLTLMTPTTIATGPMPTDFTIHPSGKYAYVTNAGDTTVSQYMIGANGGLLSMSTATVSAALAGSYGMWISVDPSGTFAYVGKWDNTNIVRYRIGQGALTADGIATTINVFPGKMLFAKKPITPAGPNTGVVTGSPSSRFFAYGTTGGGSTPPAGGTSPGAGPFNLDVGFSGFGGWITGGGIDCEQGSITHTTCSAMIASGVRVSLYVTHTDANTYNVQWGGACSGTNFATSVTMNSGKGCSAALIPCNGTACTSH